MKIVVTGASGFVGSHVVARLVADKHEVVGLARSAPIGARKSSAAQYRSGIDVADASSLSDEDFAGADTVIHLVGIIAERPPKQTFQRIHVDGTRNVVEAARRAGAARIVYVSAIGSDPTAAAQYSRTKAAAEEIVRSSGLLYTILRPSIILGPDGEFVAQMRSLVRHGGLPIRLPVPIIPVPGSGNNRFQPVFIDDLVECVAGSVAGRPASEGKTVELAGATQVTFNALIDAFAQAEHVRKPKFHAPIFLLSLAAPVVERMHNPPFTADQLKNLKSDNIAVSIAPMEEIFGVHPLTFPESMALVHGPGR